MFSPLINLTYRYLFMAQVLSLLGTGLATVALGLLAYDLAGADAGAVLGTAFAIKMVAYVGIAPVAGAFVHLVPRRALLVVLDVLRAAVAMALPFVTEIWQVYLLIFMLQTGSAAFTPAFQATILDILQDEAKYTKALSLSRLAYDLEALASPAIAAAMLGLVGFHWLFAGNALGFMASAALVITVGLPSPTPPMTQEGAWGRITRGARIYPCDATVARAAGAERHSRRRRRHGCRQHSGADTRAIRPGRHRGWLDAGGLWCELNGCGPHPAAAT